MYIKDLNIVRYAGANPKLMTCHLYCVWYITAIHIVLKSICMLCVE